MKILVTGHRGYLGALIVPKLLGDGHEVTGLDMGYFDGCDFGETAPPVPALDLDLRDVQSEQLQGFDAVIHLAALSNDPLGDLNPGLTYTVNFEGSLLLAEAAKAAGVGRFLHSSSCSLYGAGSHDELDESAAFNPVTPYGESKVRAELAISRLSADKFAPVFLRNATAYGVSPRLRGDIVVNNLVGSAVTTGEILLRSDGAAWRPLVHARDIAAAFIACLEAPLDVVRNQAFNVGRTGENYRVIDIARVVSEIVPGCAVRIQAGSKTDVRDYRVRFDKIARALPGFKPTWSLRAGVEELFAAYTSRGLDLDEWSSDRYFRLPRIQSLLRQGRLDADLRWQ